jgi:hypothetical protein
VQPSRVPLDNIVSLALRVGVASSSVEGAAWARSSGKLSQGLTGGVLDWFQYLATCL